MQASGVHTGMAMFDVNEGAATRRVMAIPWVRPLSILFFGLVVWIFHTLGPATVRAPNFIFKLRGVGVLTWLYALIQMVDMRFYNSRFAKRRRAQLRIPESLNGWLLGQMVAWFGIVYYGLTEDLRWFVAGLVIFGLSFWAFPVREEKSSNSPT